MALIVKTIGSGGGRDFSTLAAWEASLPANLVTDGNSYEGDCFNDTEFTSAANLLTLSGHTTDASHTITLTTGAGQSFKDYAGAQTNALKYNHANGVGISCTGGYALAVVVDDANVTLRGLQITTTVASGLPLEAKAAGTAFAADQCIIEGKSGAATFAPGQTWTNCLFIDKTSGDTWIVHSTTTGSSGITFNFCTFVAPSDLASKVAAVFNSPYGAYSADNCAFFGCTAVNSGSATLTFSHCMSDIASPPAGVTGGKTFANQFQNTTTASEDWREKAGADLAGAGANLGANAAHDIIGSARPQGANYDIGCWQLVASGTLVTADSGCAAGWRATVYAGATPYVGLGDIYGPAVGYWGLRAFSAAAAAARVNAIQLQRASDGATKTITVLSNGGLDLATAAAFLSGTTGGISIWYDQSGNGHDMVQATQAKQPQFTFNAIGSQPAATFDGSTTFLEYSTGIANVNAPALYSVYAQAQMGVTHNVNYVIADSVSGGWVGWQVDGSGSDNVSAFFFSVPAVVTSANNAWHSAQFVANQGSSSVTLDGVTTAWSFPANNPQIGGPNAIGCDIGGVSGPYTSFFKGPATEIAAFAVLPTAAQLAAAAANQNVAWALGTWPAVPAYALEAGAAVRADRNAPLEAAAMARADASARAEAGAALSADARGVIEQRAVVRSDAAARLGWLASAHVDLVGPVEWTGAVLVAAHALTPLEWPAAVRRSARADLGYLGSVRGEFTGAAELLSAARISAAARLGFTTAVRQASEMPAEWTGAVLIAADALTLLEWAAGVRGSTRAGLAYLSSMHAAAQLPGEELASLLRELGVPAEGLANGGTLAVTDAMMPLEWLGPPPGLVVSLATPIISPGRVRILTTPGRVRLLRRK